MGLITPDTRVVLEKIMGETRHVMRPLLEAFWPSRRIDAFDGL